MKNGTMFSDLEKYANESFYKEHGYIRFDTLSEFGTYEIFAVFRTTAYSADGFKYYNFVDVEDVEDFNNFIGKCKELSLYATGLTAEYGDKLLTLSTCEYTRTNGRFVVVAKLVKDHG
jgi:sortase B